MPVRLMVFIQFVIAISSLLLFSGCLITRNNQEVVATQPKPTTGGKIITLENGRTRCGFESQLGANTYKVVCHAMIVEASGNEALATEIAEGLRLKWLDPTSVEGSELDRAQCNVENAGLTQSCEVVTADAGSTTVKFQLDFNDGQKVESDTVLLPWSVETMGRTFQTLSLKPVTSNGSRNLYDQIRGLVTSMLQGFEAEEALYQGFQSVKHEGISFPIWGKDLCSMGGALYFTSGNFIYHLDPKTGQVSLYAGTTPSTKKSDLSHRLRIRLESPTLVCGPDALYVRETASLRLLKIPVEGAVQEIMKAHAIGDSGDNGPALTAQTSPSSSIASDSPGFSVSENGEIYLADTLNHRIRKIDKNGMITTIVGDKRRPWLKTPINGPTNGLVQLNLPVDVLRVEDSLYIFESGYFQILRLNLKTGYLDVWAPDTENTGREETTHLAKWGTLSGSLTSDSKGAIYYPNINMGIIKLDPQSKAISLFISRQDTATNVGPSAVAFDSDNSLYTLEKLAGDADNRVIRKFDLRSNTITRFAGAPLPPPSEGALVSEVFFGNLTGIEFAPNGSIYLTGAGPNQIHRVDPISKRLYREAGNGIAAATLGSGNAATASLNTPINLLTARDGSLYFTVSSGYAGLSVIQKIEAETKNLVTIAGTGDEIDKSEYLTFDGLPAVQANFPGIGQLAVDAQENLYFTDIFKGLIRRVDSTTNILTSIVPPELTLLSPEGLALDESGYLLVADTLNRRIVRINPTNPAEYQILALEGSVIDEARSTFEPTLLRAVAGEIYVVNRSKNQIYRLRRKQHSAQTYEVSIFFGDSVSDCGTKGAEGLNRRSEVDAALEASIASICSGRVTAMAVRNTCHLLDSPSIQMAISQSYDRQAGSSNIVRITRPCPN